MRYRETVRSAPDFVFLASVVVAWTTLSCGHEQAAPLNVSAPGPVAASNGSVASPIGASPFTAPYQTGLATWYGQSFAGKKTSNGERFDPRAMTAAHRKLPFGTWVEVRRVDTGTVVVVRINDRGPWGHERRVIDLSQGAAERLGMVPLGPTPVEIRVVRGPD